MAETNVAPVWKITAIILYLVSIVLSLIMGRLFVGLGLPLLLFALWYIAWSIWNRPQADEEPKEEIASEDTSELADNSVESIRQQYINGNISEEEFEKNLEQSLEDEKSQKELSLEDD